jgi:hypothetical protein
MIYHVGSAEFVQFWESSGGRRRDRPTAMQDQPIGIFSQGLAAEFDEQFPTGRQIS